MAASGFSISITAIDAATAQIDKVNKRLAALKAPAENLNKSFSKFASLSGVSTAWTKMHDGVKKVFDALGKMVPLLGTLTGVGILTGLTHLVSTWSSFGQQLLISSRLLDLLPNQLQTLQNANRLAGGSAADATSKFANLSRTLGDVAWTRASAETTSFFLSLGLSMEQIKAMSLDTASSLPFFANKIKELHDNGVSAVRILQLFGQFFTDQEIAASMEDGAAGLKKFNDEAAKYSLTKEQTVALAEMEKQLTGVQLQLEYLGATLATALLPVVEPWITKLKEWLSHQENLDWLTGELTTDIKELGTWLKAIGHDIQSVVHFFGGWQHVIEAILVLKISGFVIGLISPFFKLGREIKGANGSLADMLGNLKLIGPALAALAAHEVLKSVDPEDKMGAWIDKNIPGAAAIDNFASKFGLGRSYEEQGQVQGNIDNEPPAPSSPHNTQKGGAHTGGLTGSTQGGTASGQFDQMAPRIMGDLQKDFGLTNAQASGVLGSLGTETGGFKYMQEINPVGGGRGGLGWAQWTGPRRRQFEQYCKDNNLDPSSYAANYGFMKKELQTDYAGVMADLKQQTNQQDATTHFEQGYEGAGVPNMGSRLNYASRAMQLIHAKPQTITGSIDANIKVDAPPGTSATASSSGAVNAPKVVQPMASYA